MSKKTEVTDMICPNCGRLMDEIIEINHDSVSIDHCANCGTLCKEKGRAGTIIPDSGIIYRTTVK